MFFLQMRTAFPDLNAALEALVADDESIAFVYTLTGTHQGPLGRIAPTGRKMKIRGLQFSKFKDCKMIERWGSSDELGLLTQLGVTQLSQG
jgi:predicted ester cyclase